MFLVPRVVQQLSLCSRYVIARHVSVRVGAARKNKTRSILPHSTLEPVDTSMSSFPLHVEAQSKGE